MKKWSYMTVAFLLGVVVTISGGEVAAQVKSLIGQKVTGEYTVVVNGSTLSDKGAIIDSKANVPARSLSEALGADVKVEGKTIYITQKETKNDVVVIDGKYYTKYDLLNLKKKTEDKLNGLTEVEKRNKERYEGMIKEGLTETAEQLKEADERQMTEMKQNLNNELQKIDEALKQFE